MLELIKAILILLGILIGGVFVLFPKSRVLFKAFGNLFFDNMAATPEGAEALYSQKIEEAMESYRNAKDAFNLAAGRLKTTHSELEQYQNELDKLDAKCKNLAQKGDRESLMVMAQERENVIQNISHYQDLIDKYKAVYEETKAIYEQADRNVEQLKQEKTDTVRRMKDNRNIKELYDQVDKIRGVSSTDKLLDVIRDKDKELNEMAEGAKVIHQNKLSTRLQIAEKNSADQETLDYVNQMMAKYSNTEKRPLLRDK